MFSERNPSYTLEIIAVISIEVYIGALQVHCLRIDSGDASILFVAAKIKEVGLVHTLFPEAAPSFLHVVVFHNRLRVSVHLAGMIHFAKMKIIL